MGTVDPSALDHAYGALAGLALGDALGMPTQSFTREQITARFGRLDDLVAAPADQPIAPGMPAGRVTDDTEQALLLAEHLLARGGRVEARDWAGELDRWEQGMAARGSADLLGPSTRRAIAAIRAGADPTEAGSAGTTNGAAMRITPVALTVSWGRGADQHRAFLERVAEACRPTHHTGLAIAGAAAVAAAVSAAVDGIAGQAEELCAVATKAAQLGAAYGREVPGPSVAARLGCVSERAAHGVVDEDWIVEVLGTTVATQESVPAAFALLDLALDDPRQGLLAAARLGGDTDTIGAMLGAMTGAVVGRSGLPAPWCDRVESANGLRLEDLARRLLALRAAG